MKKKKKTVKANGVSRTEVVEALNLVKPALGRSEAISEIFTHFAFDGKNVMAYNDYAFIKTPLNVPVECTVIGEPFYNLVNSIPGDSISITMDGNELSVKTKSIKSKFRTLEIREFSEPSKFPQKGKRLPANFFQALDYCIETVFKTRAEPLLHTIAIVDNEMLSTDQSRISIFPLGTTDFPNMIIPLESAEVILAARDQILNYEVVTEAKWDAWLGFNLATGGVLTGKLMVGEYAPVREIVHPEKFTESITFPEEIRTVVSRCQYFSEGLEKLGKKNINLEIADGKMTCYLQNPALGDYKETIPIDSKMETLLCLDLDALDRITQITLNAKLNPSMQNLILFYEEEFGYTQAIALVG